MPRPIYKTRQRAPMPQPPSNRRSRSQQPRRPRLSRNRYLPTESPCNHRGFFISSITPKAPKKHSNSWHHHLLAAAGIRRPGASACGAVAPARDSARLVRAPTRPGAPTSTASSSIGGLTRASTCGASGASFTACTPGSRAPSGAATDRSDGSLLPEAPGPCRYRRQPGPLDLGRPGARWLPQCCGWRGWGAWREGGAMNTRCSHTSRHNAPRRSPCCLGVVWGPSR